MSFCNSENKITKGWFGPLLVVLTEDPDCIQTIFKSPHTQDKPYYFYNGFYMDEGLFVCNGSQYDRHRKIFSKSFSVSMIQKFLPTFNEKSKKCVEKMSKHLGQGDFDVFDYVGTCMLEAFCTKQLNYERDFYDSNFMKLLHEVRPLVMKRMFSPWFNCKPLYKISSLGRKLDGYNKIMLQHIEKIVNANVTSPEKALEKSVIDMLLNPDNKFSECEFRDEMITFIFTVS
jgi:cytochrome P450